MPNWTKNVLVESTFIGPNVLFFALTGMRSSLWCPKFPLPAKQLPTYLLTTLVSCPHMLICRAVLVELLHPFIPRWHQWDIATVAIRLNWQQQIWLVLLNVLQSVSKLCWGGFYSHATRLDSEDKCSSQTRFDRGSECIWNSALA